MSKTTTLTPRANIILVLEKIHHGQSLSTLLDKLLASTPDNQKGFCHELLLGTLRQWFALNRIGESFIKVEPTDVGIICALNMGIYELLYMKTPDYAVINETLNALKLLNKSYGVGLVNAILRKVANNKEKFTKKVHKNHSLPNWLAKIIKQDWTDIYDILGQTLRQTAPIYLRPNAKFCNELAYSELLSQQEIGHQLVELGFANKQTIVLSSSVKIPELPKFQDGFVSVQDRHAQLSAHILHDVITKKIDKNPLNVLDACSAPGGKTAHLLEIFSQYQGQFHLTSLDNHQDRLTLVGENLQRLQLLDKTVSIVADDARTFKTEQKFNVVLLDAPCTATGVIRRNPDIGLLRQEHDVAQTVQLQAEILDNLWQNVVENGYLLYVTCSLLKAENETQMINFIEKNRDVQVVDFELTLPNQVKQKIGYQCLPLNENDGDGFYYALLQKAL